VLAALAARSVARAKGLLIALAGLLCAFQVLVIVSAREIYRGQMFTQLASLIPSGLQQMAGGLVFTSFTGLASFGFFHPVVILVFVEAAIFVAAEPAWEVEAGMVDLTLARPVPRALMISRTLLVSFGAAAALALLMVLSTRLALHAFAPASVAWPRLETTTLLAVNLAVLAWCFAALSVLIATTVRRRSTAVGITGLAAVLLYLVHVLAELWRPAYPLRLIAPYHYYNAPALLASTGNGWQRDVAVLLGLTALFSGGAYFVYSRRDL
jgi:ABC-type transport system involved in multi-copper enzyme maturation permease subunit